MSNTPNIQTEVKSKTDFNFTKDDILLILLQQKEEELLQKIDEAKAALKDLYLTESKIKEALETNIVKIVSKNLKNSDPDLKIKILNLSYAYQSNYNSKEAITVSLIDIDKISSVTNVKLAIKRSTRTYTYNKIEFRENNPRIELDFEKETEFLGEKSVFSQVVELKLKPEENSNKILKDIAKKVKPLILDYIDAYNSNFKSIKNLEQEINDLEVQILLLDADKSLKASLYKQILANNPELKKLIT